jgi:hypothetical protein
MAFFEEPSQGRLNGVVFSRQTGYLTIDKVSLKDQKEFYNLKVPNFEIKDWYHEVLNSVLSRYLIKDFNQESKDLTKAIKNKNGEAFTNMVSSLYTYLAAQSQPHQTLGESIFSRPTVGLP